MTKSNFRLTWLVFIILVLALSLSACVGKSLVGKWEIVSGTDLSASIGNIYEFFEDGTVNTGYMAVEYSMPDKTHIKFGVGGAGLVYEYTLDGDTLILKNSNTQAEITFKKYQEFEVTNESISGNWRLDYPNESDCFKKLGLFMSPNSISFGKDGAFTASDSADITIAASSMTMNGQYTINEKDIHVVASGTESSSGFFGMNPSSSQLQGEFDCSVTLSNSRLTFKDAQGQITIYTKIN